MDMMESSRMESKRPALLLTCPSQRCLWCVAGKSGKQVLALFPDPSEDMGLGGKAALNTSVTFRATEHSRARPV